ncbi:MAG: tRNA epoxyqueuosine(34) reductase QueG [Verrucomicrobiota bacterium]
MKNAIQQRALELGFDLCRFTSAAPPPHAREFTDWLEAERHGQMGYLQRNAEKRTDPQRVLPGARTIICLAASYATDEDVTPSHVEKQSARPWELGHTLPLAGVIARYARFRDYHDVLGESLKQLTHFVNEQGGPDARSLWYVDTGPFLERDLAERAGVGFVGKHTNLISRELGNWFFLAEIITTLEIEPDAPERNRCGSCRRCLEACPTQAIAAPFQLDARRCISYLTIELKGSIPVELRPLVGTRIYGCDDCLAVCPWNKFAREGRLMRDVAIADLQSPDLVDLLSLDDAAFQRKFSGTPMLRTKRRGFLRNVCVALGNLGDRRALPALERAAQDPEPLIAEHARWASAQIEAKASVQTREE